MLRHCSTNTQQQQQQRHRQSIPATALAPATMPSTTFSLFSPLPCSTKAHQYAPADWFDDDDSSSAVIATPPSPSSSSTGSVDCTLSLGTPSSRLAAPKQRPLPASSCGTMPWDVAAAADQSCCCCRRRQGSSSTRPSVVVNKSAVMPCAGQDPLLVDRRCANCGTSSTPLWRNGPCGPKSLCNACGIRFKKKERRAAAAAAMDQGGCGYVAERSQYAAAGTAYYGSCEGPAFPCDGGDVADAEAAPQNFLAWRLDVVAPAQAQAAAFAAVWPEQTTLFQYN
ncbi:GATA transcription factor 15 [Zea mays]|uniref:GATA transcription factor 15 n=1 Tax=Zea mays TaxID=4577 RepID=A0A3L6ECR1_MAIZE|nr:GATA transcription factor 15 [Zea mays]